MEMIIVVFGYCRISKPTQNIERQERNILASFPNAKIYKEVYTGIVLSRQEWQKLIKKVHKGDTIVKASHTVKKMMVLYGAILPEL